VVETVSLVVTTVLAVGLLVDRLRRPAIVGICFWSIGAAVALSADQRWGWLTFYAICGLGGLIGLGLELSRSRRIE